LSRCSAQELDNPAPDGVILPCLPREELRSVTEQLTLENSRSAYGPSDGGPPDGVGNCEFGRWPTGSYLSGGHREICQCINGAISPHLFCSRNDVPENTPDIWRDVLREAIGLYPPPILGTHFRSAVDDVISRRGERPPSESFTKFIQILERYPDVLLVLRRPGEDFLVAPADRRDAFARQVQEQWLRIRHDIFQAFTTISDNKPFYDKTSDKVVWRSGDDPEPIPEQLSEIESATAESEVRLRHDFAERQEAPKAHLLAALETPLPLQSFGQAIKDLGLQASWHRFRTERVIEKMQLWASTNRIDWKDAWLARGRSTYAERVHPLATPSESESRSQKSGAAERTALEALFVGLDAADIQRIAIPLDLVLKAMTAKGK
jgi:hypothetical protein